MSKSYPIQFTQRQSEQRPRRLPGHIAPCSLLGHIALRHLPGRLARATAVWTMCVVTVTLPLSAATDSDAATPSQQPRSAQQQPAQTTESEGQPTAKRSDDEVQSASESKPSDDEPTKKLFTGKVVSLHQALKRHGVTAYEKEIDDQVVLETSDGRLIPIVPDWRGRAFFQDERLRNRKVDLVGQRRARVPYLQVLMIFTYDEQGHRQYTDYWCDVCSIPMYEIKPCDCCQGDVRLRFQQNRGLPDYLDQPATPDASAKGKSEQAPAVTDKSIGKSQ